MPELRKDPVTGRWVIIAVERSRRPNDFFRNPVESHGVRVCPFCPGNEDRTPPEIAANRNGSAPDTPGWTLRVVPNKFPALRGEGDVDRTGEGLYDRMNGIGAHEVIIESPEHSATLALLSEPQVAEILHAYRDRIAELKKDIRLRYVLIFKNHGEAAGASLEHIHSQLIALPVVPRQVQEELEGSLRYFDFRERCIFCDIVRQESRDGARAVLETDHFLALEPYAPRFPFETWIVPRKHASHFETADDAQLANLAWVMRMTMRKLDKVLEHPSYNYIIHTAPVQEGAMTYYHWHIEIIPKLTKVAGFEWGTGFYINPTPPEEAAHFLREAGLT
ncbi:MAG: galactose-1-phosphate uridylyltransferase [Bryobacteraceae bacterium]